MRLSDMRSGLLLRAVRRALLLRAVFTQLAVATFEADGIHKALLEVRHSPKPRRRSPHAHVPCPALGRVTSTRSPAWSPRCGCVVPPPAG